MGVCVCFTGNALEDTYIKITRIKKTNKQKRQTHTKTLFVIIVPCSDFFLYKRTHAGMENNKNFLPVLRMM